MAHGNPPEIIYLNNAATTWPKPKEVIQEVVRSLELPYYEEGRTTLRGQADYPALAREILAGFFRAADPSHIVFTRNATDSLNMVIHGFAHQHRETPFHVVTTRLEHNAVLRPLRTLEREGRITLSIVPFEDGYVAPQAIREALRDDTRMVVMTHGSNVLGTVQDVGAIGRHLRSQDIFFVVDGAQTAGHASVDLSALPVDVFVFTGHKGLYGLPGIGGFYIQRPEVVDAVRQGGTGVESARPYHTDEMPLKFECGTHNYPGIASLYAGVRYLMQNGPDRLERRTMENTEYLVRVLREEESVVLHNDAPDLPVIPFSVEGMDSHDVGFILARMYSVICRTGLHCAPLVHESIDGGRGCVRLSLSSQNTREQCEAAARAIREVVQRADR
ncbi:MAG: aminotransferase class V-fold PLP-dependent enzyme [Methanomicrobiales archaeon]|nr:aminotransferase class V-fold PLP-dependent enzyme [Methanomicrobiales archaeon]